MGFQAPSAGPLFPHAGPLGLFGQGWAWDSQPRQARAIFEAAAEVGKEASRAPVAEVMVPLVATFEDASRVRSGG